MTEILGGTSELFYQPTINPRDPPTMKSQYSVCVQKSDDKEFS